MLDQHARTSAARRLSLVVALTIRTDRYEALQTAPQLAAVKGVVFDDVKPMPQGQFKEVIVGPARRATEGGRPLQLEPALVEKLLAECTDGADTLPLLSLTLARLFEDYGSDGNLTLAEYESMGGMSNVVQTEVDGLLSRDDTTRRAQLGQLRSAFIPWLATISPDTDQPLRRVARWDDLPAEARPLLDGFVGKRLLIKDKRKSGDVIEVALESLLRHWDELRKWLEEERENLKRAAGLERSAAEWRKNGCKREWLLEGDQIIDARKLFEKPGFQDLLSSAREFVEESGRVEDDTKRRARRGSIMLRTFIAAAVVTALVAGFTLLKWMVSEQQNQARMREATAWRLVSESDQMLEGARAGGDVRALQQLLAANRLGATSAEAVVNTRRDQLRILENPLRPDGVTAVRSVAVSPDGHRIASGSDDHKVRLWDTDTGKQLAELVVAPDSPEPDQQRPVWGVAFSPDGKWIATGSGARYLQVWDANSGKKIGGPMTHSEAVHSVAFSPDSRLIATGSDDGAVRVWDWATGQEAVKFAGHDPGTTVRSVAFSPGGDLIASGGDDGTARLWDAHTGRLVARVGDGSTAMSVAFSLDGARVVVGRDDGTVEIMDGRNGWTVVDSFYAHPNAVTSVVFSPDGTRIVSGGADNSVRVWNSVDHTPIGRPLIGHHGSVSSIVLNSQGTMIVSGSLDGSVREWDVGGLPIPAGQGAIRTVAFRPDGRQIASAGRDGTVKLWDPVTATPIGQLGESSPGYEHAINALAFSPDGSRILTGATDGSVRLWEVKTRQARTLPMVDPAGRPAATHARITSVAFSPDGMRVVSGGNDGAVRVWDAHSLTSIGVMTAQIVDERGKPMPYPVWSVAFSPDGRQIASGSGGYDNSIQLWDVASRAADGPPMVSHPGWNIYSVGFSGDGQRIVSGSNDGTIRVWNVKTRQQVAKMSGDENSVLSVAFAHNHPWIVSGHADGAVRVWDANTFQPIGAPQAGHQDWVHTVAFSPDDARILSGSADGDLQLWSAPRDLAEVVCSKLSANMSHKQWNDWVSPKIDYIQMCPGLDVPPDEQ